MNALLKSAPEIETRGLRDLCSRWDTTPKEFFDLMADELTGLVIDGRPVYLMALVNGAVWTVVNSRVREQKTLFSVAKRFARDWARKYKRITATMFSGGNEKNIRWTERLGFKRLSEENGTITFEMEVI